MTNVTATERIVSRMDIPRYLLKAHPAGKYRIGGDQLLVDGSGKSRISIPDYAVALLDRIENNGRSRQRITVAY